MATKLGDGSVQMARPQAIASVHGVFIRVIHAIRGCTPPLFMTMKSREKIRKLAASRDASPFRTPFRTPRVRFIPFASVPNNAGTALRPVRERHGCLDVLGDRKGLP